MRHAGAPRRWITTLYMLPILAIACACSGGSGVPATSAGQLIAASERVSAGSVNGKLLMTPGDYRLSDDLGQVVMLNFFASWCGPCQAETPQIDALYRELPSSAIHVIGVDTKDLGTSRSRAWITTNKISYPIIWDQPGKVSVELGHIAPPGLPFTILIDKQGKIAAFYLGQVFPADLRPAIAKLDAEAA